MKARVALLASLFSFALVAVVAAQVTTTTGTVVSNSGGVLVVETDSGQRSFMVDAQSSVPANLAVGSRVTVEFHTLANNQFHAFKVTPSAAAPTTTRDTSTTGTTGSMTGTTGSTSAQQDRPSTTTTSPSMGTTTGTMQERPNTTTEPATRTDTTTTGTTTTDDTTTPRTLPATASPLPLLALAGSLALAGGALLRRRRA